MIARNITLAVLVAVTVAVGLAAFLPQELKITDRLLIVFTYAIAVATLAAVFQQEIRSWFRHPTLSLAIEPSPPDCHKTSAYGPNNTLIPCYYYRVRIWNRGRAPARDVEVTVTNAERRAGKQWEPFPAFHAQWLQWAGLRNVPTAVALTLPMIPRGAFRYCDLGKVRMPGHVIADHPLEEQAGLAGSQTIFFLDVFPLYLRMGHVFPQGRYRFTLQISASNATPKDFTVTLNNSGNWYDDEARMLKDGVTIEEVAPA